MDRYELNIKTEQIKKLARQKDYAAAAKVADGIDFYRIKDNKTLSLLADVYEASGRYEQAKDILTEAYARTSLGRQLAYRLVKLCIKSGNIGEAEEFYQDFAEAAPRDNSKYILQYELAAAKGEPLDKRIAILETYLSDDMDEKWSFELAKLYHKTGQKEKCVRQCDDVMLWFNDGKYVDKAMELKMIYAPLTKTQQAKYEERWMSKAPSGINVEDIKVKEYDAANQYNTVNIQDAIKESMDVLMNEEDIADTEADIEEKCRLEAEKTKVVFTDEVINSLLSHTVTDVRIPQSKYNTVSLSPLLDMDKDGQIELNMDEPVDDQIEGQMTVGELLEAYERREAREAAMKEAGQSEPEGESSAVNDSTANEANEANEAVEEDEAAGPEERTSEDGIAPEEQTEEAVQEQSEEPAQEQSEKAVQEQTEEAVQEQAEEMAQEQTEEAAQEQAEEMAQEQTEEPTQDKAVEQTEQVAFEEEMMGVTADLSGIQAALAEAAAAIISESSDKIPNLGAAGQKAPSQREKDETDEDEAVEDIEITAYSDAPEDTPEDASEDVPEDTSEDASEDMPEYAEEEMHAEAEETQAEAEEAADMQGDIRDEENIGAAESTEGDAPDVTDAETEKEPSEGAAAMAEAEAKKRSGAETADGNMVKELIRDFVTKYSGVQGLDRQLLMVLQESLVNDNSHIVVMGEVKSGKTALAIDLVKIINKIRQTRGRKIAKINAEILNSRNVTDYFEKLADMDIIIEKAAVLSEDTMKQIALEIEGAEDNRIVVLEDEKNNMEGLLRTNGQADRIFKSRIVVKQNRIRDWAVVARNYAGEQGYEIEEMGMLALHARIDELYAISLVINKNQVEDIIDKAIDRSKNRGLGRILRVFGKEREKILREEDF